MRKQKHRTDDIAQKHEAAEHLRSADRHLKSGMYDEALKEVELSLQLDPGNFYARAFRERIIAIQKDGTETPGPSPTMQPSNGERAGAAVTSSTTQKVESVDPPKASEQPAEAKPSQEEARKKFLEEQHKSAEDAKKRAVEERRRIEEELRRRALEFEVRHKHEQEERRGAEEALLKTEAVRKALEEQLSQKDQEVQMVLEAERRAFDDKLVQLKQEWEREHQRKLEASERRLREEFAAERQRLETEISSRTAAEARRVQNEFQQRLESERARIQTESQQRIQDLEKNYRDQDQQRQKSVEAERKRLEADVARRVDQLVRQHVETELRKNAQVERERQLQDHAKRTAEEEGRSEARRQKAQSYLAEAKRRLTDRAYEDALVDVMKVYAIDPDYPGLLELEQQVRKVQREVRKLEFAESQKSSTYDSVEIYRQVLSQTWLAGDPTLREHALLERLRIALNVSEEQHRKLEEDIKRELTW
jgi:hypothetical protein